MKNIILTLFYIGITIGNAWADEPRNQTVVRSRNEHFTFKLKKNNWNMTDSKGNMLYSIPEKGFVAMSVFITNDGKNVVVMDDLISGSKLNKKTVLRFFMKVNKPLAIASAIWSKILAISCTQVSM
jgi:hypothetical protein